MKLLINRARLRHEIRGWVMLAGLSVLFFLPFAVLDWKLDGLLMMFALTPAIVVAAILGGLFDLLTALARARFRPWLRQLLRLAPSSRFRGDVQTGKSATAPSSRKSS